MINILDRIKFAFRKDKELYSSLYRILGFYPHNIEIYRIAFSHRSLPRRNEKGRPLNNERLEFLGDAVLEAAVSDLLFHHFERKREGFLTSTRSKIVSRETLNRLASELGIDLLVKSATKPTTHNSNLGGNAFEALIGAIYLDRGYDVCKWFLAHRIMGKLMDIDGIAHKEVNFKSKLLEWSQKNRIQAKFTLDDSEGAGTNSPVFRTSVHVEGLLAGEGKGYSKKESQQQAAKEALTKLRREPQFIDRIFKQKEKRTAMEADEFSAVPQIDEIEKALAETPAGGNAPELRTKKPVRKRTRRQAQKAAEAEAAGQQQEMQDGAPKEEKKPERPRQPRRRPASQASEKAGKAENAHPEKNKEDIIKEAEEAAFQAAEA